MHTGQTLLTLGALILLTIAILNVNRGLSEIDISLDQNRYRLEALSLMTSYIEQATQYFFDEAVADTNATEKDVTSFTPPDQLGFDANDYDPTYGDTLIDDFDDYNGYVKIDTGRSGVVYKVMFKVQYVKLSGNKIVPSTSKEYHKMMTIYIVDNYNPPLIYKYVNGKKVRDTLKISFVYSYWFFN